MAEKSTYIKLDRYMVRWRWWKTHNTLVVFLWLLLEANVSDHEFEKEMIHRGEVATSLQSIGNSTGLSIREVRTAISHLKSTGEVTSRTRPHYQVISIVNYAKYQDVPTDKTAVNRQADDKQTTSKRQQYKNGKNGKNTPPKSPKGGLDPSGVPERGTDAFRVKSHLLLKPDEGTVDDIPTAYRDGTYGEFTDFAKYWRSRNR